LKLKGKAQQYRVIDIVSFFAGEHHSLLQGFHPLQQLVDPARW